MSVSLVQNSNVQNQVVAKNTERLKELHKDRASIKADIKALGKETPQHSGEVVLHKTDGEKLNKRLKAVEAEIARITDILHPKTSAEPVAARPPVDQVTSGAPPRAERSTPAQKAILQAPPKAAGNINNFGSQLAKWANKPGALPPSMAFKAETFKVEE